MPARGFILAAIVVLNGCFFAEPFSGPEIVAGTSTTVTLKAGALRSADAVARRYCAEYGKQAVLTTQGQLSQEATAYYLYDCVPGDTD